MKAYHRQGIGNLLLDEAEEWCADQEVAFLQVKTLSASHPDLNYAKTREFYRSVGLLELEEYLELWRSENPCLLMVKAISQGSFC
ncbi:MAG TPA: hypothetical protein DCL63_05705 [Firmicutes bacterium]|nr:hypothetical protein [Bacillota bacterium]